MILLRKLKFQIYHPPPTYSVISQVTPMEASVLEECDASIFRIEEKTDFSTLMTAYSSEGKKHYCSQSPQLGL